MVHWCAPADDAGVSDLDERVLLGLLLEMHPAPLTTDELAPT